MSGLRGVATVSEDRLRELEAAASELLAIKSERDELKKRIELVGPGVVRILQLRESAAREAIERLQQECGDLDERKILLEEAVEELEVRQRQLCSMFNGLGVRMKALRSEIEARDITRAFALIDEIGAVVRGEVESVVTQEELDAAMQQAREDAEIDEATDGVLGTPCVDTINPILSDVVDDGSTNIQCSCCDDGCCYERHGTLVCDSCGAIYGMP